MTSELEKLEAWRDRHKNLLASLQGRKIREPQVIPQVIHTATLLCQCNQKIAEIRCNMLVNQNGQTTKKRNGHNAKPGE